MKIKSANYFRQKYHTDIRGFKEGSGYDVDYIGSSHTLSTGERVKGFFDLYHGDKESIEGLSVHSSKLQKMDRQSMSSYKMQRIAVLRCFICFMTRSILLL